MQTNIEKGFAFDAILAKRKHQAMSQKNNVLWISAFYSVPLFSNLVLIMYEAVDRVLRRSCNKCVKKLITRRRIADISRIVAKVLGLQGTPPDIEYIINEEDWEWYYKA